jgi:NAD(P)-dependent dehydrogenase (short-subunit alcohol dehydrogenase family)
VTASIETSCVVVLTGGTSGIGRIAATELAAQGVSVAVIGRDRTRGETLVADATTLDGDIRFHQANLATQATVRSLAAELLDTYDRIDTLVHNAGLSSRHRADTEDGIELTFAVNHLAPYLLTYELLDRLRNSALARVVVTASDIHRRATLNFDDLQFMSDYDSLQAYARSKLATIAFTLELADRLDDTEITANCFHPGFVPSTNLFRDAPIWTRLLMHVAAIIPGFGTTPQEGAQRLCKLVTAPEFGKRTGTYVTGDGVTSPSTAAADPENRERLWNISANLVGVESDWL